MPVYRFGEFVLDTRSGELRRGSYRVRLRPQPAAVLEYLLQHPGEVITRADLRQVLWPEGTFVHFDHGLNSCIKQLRAALFDDRVSPRFLETLPRRGYRFIGEVVAEQPGAPEGHPDGGVPAEFSISGEAHRQGGRVHVSVQLNDRRTGAAVWSAEFDCDADDVASLQRRLASEVVDGLSEIFRPASASQADAVMM
jgi:DNA-binding winged helix-turn-helix (wHTH) protein